MTPTEEQRRAIECDDLDILLEAGAGSGKTSTTVDRYKRLLSEGRVTREPLEPQEILVFTFTDKAAGELRERIREQRDQMGREFSMSSLWVGTFHSICARILRAHPIAAKVDPAFDVIDDVVASRLKEEAFDAALGKTTEKDEAVALLARFNQLTLRTGIQNAYERLRAAGESDPVLPSPPPTRPPERIHADLTEAARVTLAAPDLKKNCVTRITTLLEHLGAVPAADLTFDALDAAGFFKTSKEIPELVAEVNRAKTELLTGELGPPYWSVLGDLLANYSEAYARAKSGRGGMDFEDLQLKTLDLLRGSAPIADGYREQFDEIMVDEFQDTNRLQMDLIDALRGPGTSLFTVGDEMQAIYGFRYADVELFRQRREGVAYVPVEGTEAETGYRQELFPITVLPLSANFRSQAPVIGAVNEIGNQFEELIEELRSSGEPGGRTGGTRHRFGDLRVGLEPSEGFTPKVELLLTQKEAWQEVDLGPLSPPPSPDQYLTATRGQAEAEALTLARHIRRATEEGVAPGDIVILFRTKTLMWLFEAALKQVGLVPYVVGGTGFWETREGVDLRAFLATIANPRDDESLIGTLAGPACGLSPSALWLLARRRGPEDPLWPAVRALAPGDDEIDPEDVDKATEFVRVIEELRSRQASLPLSEIVQTAVTTTGYDLVNLIRDPSGAGLANLSRVAEIAAEYEAAEGRDLRGLIDWIDDSIRLDSEQAVATEDEESDVVRLMTIHKSKGLEFPMVCVADLGRLSKSNSESVFWIAPRNETPGEFEVGLRIPQAGGKSIDLYDWPKLKERSRLDMTDEELRILHVGLTRAKRRLVLSGVTDLDEIPGQTEANSAAIRLTQGYDVNEPIEVPAPPGLETLTSAPGPSVIEVTLTRPDSAGELAEQIALDPPQGTEAVAGEPPLGRPTGTGLPEVPLSYSSLSIFEDCPARFYALKILKLDRDGDRTDPLDPELSRERPFDASEFGDAIHKVLERMPGRRWRSPGDEEIETALADRGIPVEANSGEARRLIDDFLASPIGLEVRELKTRPEIEFLLEMSNVMLRGTIDLLAEGRTGPLILDYKSNRLDGSSIGEQMKAYELQSDLYALAVARARGVERIETAFVFLRSPTEPVRRTYGEPELARADLKVSALVDDIAAGRYLGGPEASHLPCGECWACRLLRPRLLSTQKGTSESGGGGGSSA